MSEWASIQDELARKSLGKLADAVCLFEDGKITARELWLVCDTLYDIVSGIVDWNDCANVIYAVRQSLNLEPV